MSCEVNPNGFLLVGESASIDSKTIKQTHVKLVKTVALDQAVQVGLDFAKKHGDTLVISDCVIFTFEPNYSRRNKINGLNAALITKDGSVMVVVTLKKMILKSTGAGCDVAAYGPHAANVMGLTDQTDLFFTMRDAMGLAITNL